MLCHLQCTFYLQVNTFAPYKKTRQIQVVPYCVSVLCDHYKYFLQGVT